ncbi:amidohydrolase family protein [Labrys wisconsinensis]|uniref:L-fuconolactonase n=1 Tax=Labrys wisconsinensis TaxID=425677 RepID=A0ABU0J4K0_9HYPH|nr:amidohydrolase family protein [Labrys wisconsinensis]MDQ0469197.1 L-fuconolactonase [Labrys wisconsinensis]
MTEDPAPPGRSPCPDDLAGLSGRVEGFEIFDTHVHFCAPERFDYAWGAREPESLRLADATDYRRATFGLPVGTIVAMEAVVRADQIEAEAAFFEEQSRIDDRVRCMILGTAFETRADMRELVERVSRSARVRGLRLLSRYARNPRFFLETGVAGLIGRFADLGLICEIGVWPDELPNVADLARRCPATTFVLNHAGKPDIAGGRYAPWAADLAEFADLDNVVCKMSGLVTLAGAHAGACGTFDPYIRHVVRVFGADRVVFGSDWPMVEAKTSCAGWAAIVLSALADRPPSEIRSIMHDNAARIYAGAPR